MEILALSEMHTSDLLAGVFLLAFFGVSAVHVAASYRQDAVMRRRTKGWLMPLLLAAFFCATLRAGGPTQLQQLFCVVLVLYWLGDVFLAMTTQGGHKFVIGGVSFFFAHVLTIAVLLDCANLPRLGMPDAALWSLGLVLAYLAVVVVLAHYTQGFLAKKLQVPAVVYMAVNAAMNVAAALVCVTHFGADALQAGAGAAAWLGAVSFFLSDTVLLSVRFNKKSRFTTHTLIMVTYLSATLLLSYAVLVLG